MAHPIPAIPQMIHAPSFNLVNPPRPHLEPHKSQNSTNRKTLPLDQTDYSIARTQDDYEKAFRLLYEEYVRSRYTSPCKSQMRYSIYNALAGTRTIIAKEGQDVVGCATIIADSVFGIPMDNEYHDEISKLRKTSRLLGEVSGLAIDPKCRKYDIQIILKLIISIVAVARDMGIDRICIAINPKHLTFYTRGLAAEKITHDSKPYQGANNAPSYALTMSVKDLCTFIQGGKKKNFAYKMIHSCLTRDTAISDVFFNTDQNRKSIEQSRMNVACLKHFFGRQPSFFSSFNQEQINYFFVHHLETYQVLLPDYLRYLQEKTQSDEMTEQYRIDTGNKSSFSMEYVTPA